MMAACINPWSVNLKTTIDTTMFLGEVANNWKTVKRNDKIIDFRPLT